MATDGIVTNKQPQYLDLSTPAGPVPRREREWMIDEGPYSKNTFTGTDTYFQFSLYNYSETAVKLNLKGMVVYDEKEANSGYQMICLASNDGETWTEIGKLGSNGLPGKAMAICMPLPSSAKLSMACKRRRASCVRVERGGERR